MKKILIIAFMSVALFSCNNEKMVKTELIKITSQYEMIGETGKVQLETNDGYETAILKINDEEYRVHEVASGSGVKLATDDGKVAIHFKEGEGVLDLGDKEIFIKKSN